MLAHPGQLLRGKERGRESWRMAQCPGTQPGFLAQLSPSSYSSSTSSEPGLDSGPPRAKQVLNTKLHPQPLVFLFRLALNLKFSCLSLQSIGMPGVLSHSMQGHGVTPTSS